MKVSLIIALSLLAISCEVNAGVYDQPMALGAQWLANQQNNDGSWGVSPEIQPVYTSVAVRALEAAYKRQKAYFAGVTWLESHFIKNVDLVSRRVGSLSFHGDTLSNSLAYLDQSRDNNDGWGLSAFYNSSAVDTALALIAKDDLGQTISTQGALNFLKTTQRTGLNDKGWTISSLGNSDPAVTALVVQALARYKAVDTTLAPIITDGMTTLGSIVGLTAPPLLQALAAQAAQETGNIALSTTFLDRLKVSQAVDGSWSTADPFVTVTVPDLYATALATQAMAVASNAAALATQVTIPDEALRRAINLALGRNAMDNLTRGELAQLTTLSAVGAGIGDLTGLEWAINLSSVNFDNNNLNDIEALSGLTQLASISWIGNPGNKSWLVPILDLILDQ